MITLSTGSLSASKLGLAADVPPGIDPFYQQDPEEFIDQIKESLITADIPQGPGSRLDADTLRGFQAVSADKYGPNKLVATDSSGLLPASIIPTTVTSTFILGRDGVTLWKLVVENNGALSVDPA